MPIPSAFEGSGLLSPGDHTATIEELRKSILIEGPRSPIDGWDLQWRRYLVRNLYILTQDLWAEGVEDIFIDGSFATNKPKPGDIDGFYYVEKERQRDVHRALCSRRLEWDTTQRRLDPSSGKRKPIMWHTYRVEFFPGWWPAIKDPDTGKTIAFTDFFRRTRASRPKGVVKILKGAV